MRGNLLNIPETAPKSKAACHDASAAASQHQAPGSGLVIAALNEFH